MKRLFFCYLFLYHFDSLISFILLYKKFCTFLCFVLFFVVCLLSFHLLVVLIEEANAVTMSLVFFRYFVLLIHSLFSLQVILVFSFAILRHSSIYLDTEMRAFCSFAFFFLLSNCNKIFYLILLQYSRGAFLLFSSGQIADNIFYVI